MRSFSKFEKELIKEISKLGSGDPHLASAINDTLLRGKKRVLQNDPKNKTIFYYADKNEIQDAITDLFDLFLLLKFLEDSYLILVHQQTGIAVIGDRNTLLGDETVEGMQKVLEKIEKNKPVDDYLCAPIRTELSTALTRYFRSFIHAGSQLRFLVENDFKTQEMIEMEKQSDFARKTLESAQSTQTAAERTLRWAVFTTIIAVFTLVFSLIGSVKIDVGQFEEIENWNQELIEAIQELK